MTVPTSNLFAGSIAALVSVAVLILLVFLLAGPSYFGGLLSNAVWYILGISLVAGVVRFLFRRGGWVHSVVCGVLVAVTGYMLVVAFATSRI